MKTPAQKYQAGNLVVATEDFWPYVKKGAIGMVMDAFCDEVCTVGGTVGYTPEEYPLSGKQIAQNELQVIGSRCGRQQDLIKVVELVALGKTQTIVTDRLPFERINDALAMLREGKVLGRLVLEIDS